MSRSKRKPYIVDQSFKRYGKKFASKKVRRNSDVSNGTMYKKIYEQWDICDYKWYDPLCRKAYRK